jgi:hypothetical protein
MTNFLVKITIIISVGAKKNFFAFAEIKLFSILIYHICRICAYKKVGQNNFPSPLLVPLLSTVRDLGWEKNQDPG